MPIFTGRTEEQKKRAGVTVNVTGHLFTPRLRGHGEARVKMLLSKADMAKIGRGPGWHATVTDLLTGCEWEVKGAACGAGCFCAAEAKLVRGYDGQEA